MVNLIPATNKIHYCTHFGIAISRVVAHIRVYVMDIPKFSLLLGGRWVRAIGDYATGSYIIHDAEGRPHMGTAASDEIARGDKLPEEVPEVILNTDKKG